MVLRLAHPSRVYRGGSWFSLTRFASATYCDIVFLSVRGDSLGLRLLRRAS